MKQIELQNEKIPRAFFEMALELGEGKLNNCPASENFETNHAWNHDDLYKSLGFTDMDNSYEDRCNLFYKQWDNYVQEAMFRIHQFIEREAI